MTILIDIQKNGDLYTENEGMLPGVARYLAMTPSISVWCENELREARVSPVVDVVISFCAQMQASENIAVRFNKDALTTEKWLFKDMHISDSAYDNVITTPELDNEKQTNYILNIFRTFSEKWHSITFINPSITDLEELVRHGWRLGELVDLFEIYIGFNSTQSLTSKNIADILPLSNVIIRSVVDAEVAHFICRTQIKNIVDGLLLSTKALGLDVSLLSSNEQ